MILQHIGHVRIVWAGMGSVHIVCSVCRKEEVQYNSSIQYQSFFLLGRVIADGTGYHWTSFFIPVLTVLRLARCVQTGAQLYTVLLQLWQHSFVCDRLCRDKYLYVNHLSQRRSTDTSWIQTCCPRFSSSLYQKTEQWSAVFTLFH